MSETCALLTQILDPVFRLARLVEVQPAGHVFDFVLRHVLHQGERRLPAEGGGEGAKWRKCYHAKVT